MSVQIFAIRPLPGLSATIAAGRALGLAIYGEALFDIRPVAWTAPDPATIDALLIGSANALRHGGTQLDSLRSKPVHAVGKTTADLAAKAGFAVARTGEGGLQSLVQANYQSGAANLRFLRLSGAERTDLVLPVGVLVEERIVYRAVPLCISPAFAGRLQAGGIVLLHSAAAARHFSNECARLRIPVKSLHLAAIGPRVTTGITGEWAAIRHAACPDDTGLLALARDMCQDL